jgi:exonuclease I
MFFVMKTNQIPYLSLIYYVNQPLLHVSGMFIAHRQEIFTIYVQQLVRV